MLVLLGIPNFLMISSNSPLSLPDLDLDLAMEMLVRKTRYQIRDVSLLETLSCLSVAAEYPMCGPCRKVSSILSLTTN